MKKLAVLTLFLFGCSAVRVPVSTLGEPVPAPRGVRIAEPQVELWLEDDDLPSEAEAGEALAAARAALQEALAGRGAPDGADTVLYVRARGVARTAARREGQRAATAGLVAGAVVVVAATIWAILDRRSSPKPRRAVAAAPRPGTAPAPRPGAAPAPRPRPRPAPSGGHHGPDVDVDVFLGFALNVPPGPVPAAPAPAAEAPAPPPAAPGGAPGEDVTDPWDDAPAAEPVDPVPALPPPAPLDVEHRGFFARDEVVLDLVLVDRRTGEPIWSRSVRREIDPRDPEAMRRAVDEALADQPWARPSAAPPDPDRATAAGDSRS